MLEGYEIPTLQSKPKIDRNLIAKALKGDLVSIKALIAQESISNEYILRLLRKAVLNGNSRAQDLLMQYQAKLQSASDRFVIIGGNQTTDLYYLQPVFYDDDRPDLVQMPDQTFDEFKAHLLERFSHIPSFTLYCQNERLRRCHIGKATHSQIKGHPCYCDKEWEINNDPWWWQNIKPLGNHQERWQERCKRMSQGNSMKYSIEEVKQLLKIDTLSFEEDCANV